jgi:hypothetical protein
MGHISFWNLLGDNIDTIFWQVLWCGTVLLQIHPPWICCEIIYCSLIWLYDEAQTVHP